MCSRIASFGWLRMAEQVRPHGRAFAIEPVARRADLLENGAAVLGVRGKRDERFHLLVDLRPAAGRFEREELAGAVADRRVLVPQSCFFRSDRSPRAARSLSRWTSAARNVLLPREQRRQHLVAQEGVYRGEAIGREKRRGDRLVVHPRQRPQGGRLEDRRLPGINELEQRRAGRAKSEWASRSAAILRRSGEAAESATIATLAA